MEAEQWEKRASQGIAIEQDLRAEIERLRAESEAFRGKLAEQCGQTLVARSEIERLQALLRRHHLRGAYWDNELAVETRAALERKP